VRVLLCVLLLDVYTSSVNDVIEREQRDDYVEVVVQMAWLTDALTEW
jgi:hypothetical protein